MTYVTPAYLLFILLWWGWADAIPILRMDEGRVTPGSEKYIMISRLIILFFAVTFVFLVRMAWKRNKYNDRAGLPEVTGNPSEVVP
jgi:hypothetical protein